jgi:hypothetical protein
MGLLRFSVGRYRRLLVIGSAISIVMSAFYIGCKNSDSSGGSGSNNLKVLDPRGQPSGLFGRRGEPGSQMMAIFNPETHPTISRDEMSPRRMAPRLNSLDSKTIYIVNTGFAGAREFLEELQTWFNKNMPSVKTVLINKGGTMFSDSPELWAEIKKKADGVIFGVGG